MLTGAHRPLESQPNVACLHYMYKRHDSSHFPHRPAPSRIYTLTSYRDTSTQRHANQACLKRRREWKRLCGIIEPIHGDDPASLRPSPFRFFEAGTTHQLLRNDVKMVCWQIDIGPFGMLRMVYTVNLSYITSRSPRLPLKWPIAHTCSGDARRFSTTTQITTLTQKISTRSLYTC